MEEAIKPRAETGLAVEMFVSLVEEENERNIM